MEESREDWDEIVRGHALMAFDAAWRLLGHRADTEVVVQEALLDAFRLHKAQPVASWGALLRQLATRRAIDRLRQRRQFNVVPLQTFEPFTAEADQPASVAIERELADRLRAGIAALADRQATVFSLHYFGELANREIAQTLGISTDAVGVALCKARRRLKTLLGLPESVSRRPRR